MPQKMSNKRKHHTHTKKGIFIGIKGLFLCLDFPKIFFFVKKSLVKLYTTKCFRAFLIVGSIHYSSMFHKCRHWHWNNTQQPNEGKQNINVMWFQCLHVSSTYSWSSNSEVSTHRKTNFPADDGYLYTCLLCWLPVIWWCQIYFGYIHIFFLRRTFFLLRDHGSHDAIFRGCDFLQCEPTCILPALPVCEHAWCFFPAKLHHTSTTLLRYTTICKEKKTLKSQVQVHITFTQAHWVVVVQAVLAFGQ